MITLKDVFINLIRIFKTKRKCLLIVFIIEVFSVVSLFLIFNNNTTSLVRTFLIHLYDDRFDLFPKLAEQGAYLFFIIWYPISILITSYTTKVVYDVIFEKKSTVLDNLLYTIKNAYKFLIPSLILFLLVFFLYCFYFVFQIIHLFNILILASGIIITFIVMGYFRFAPYVAFMTRDLNNSFDDSKSFLEGIHYFSFFIMLIPAASVIVLDMYKPIMYNSSTAIDYLMWILIAVVSTAIIFFFRILDISMVATGYKFDDAIVKEKREEFMKNLALNNNK